jgi:hypothetical protein
MLMEKMQTMQGNLEFVVVELRKCNLISVNVHEQFCPLMPLVTSAWSKLADQDTLCCSFDVLDSLDGGALTRIAYSQRL